MPEKRVVYPVFTGAVGTQEDAWSIVMQAMTSVTSYFDAYNEVPVIVATDDEGVEAVFKRVAAHKKWPLTVERHAEDDVRKMVSDYVNEADRKSRADVTRVKIYTMLHVAKGFDRLIVDADTLFFRVVRWHEFDGKDFLMFRPSEWDHPLSITVRQMLYFCWRETNIDTFEEYLEQLIAAHPHWGGKISLDGPWPNSGVIYMTDSFRKLGYMKALNNLDRKLLQVEDEGVYFNYLNTVLPDGSHGMDKSLSDDKLNVPVAFTDISMENHPTKPYRIIIAHFHQAPKPDKFEISYSGVVKPLVTHKAWSLAYDRVSMAGLQCGTMSGILWTYVWHFFFSLTARLYRNGNEIPVYPPETWLKIINTYLISRNSWFLSRKA